MQTLKNLIENLKNNDNVDALCIVGSQGIGEEKIYSDIDLAVIFKENTQKLFSLFQFIDGKPADIFFYDIQTLEKLMNDQDISANTMGAVLVSWLETANIGFDKSGTLSKLKKDIQEVKAKMKVPVVELKKFESWINSAYITNKRYFESNNPEYHELLEIKLLQDTYNLLMAYFEFRNIPWRGEKQVMRYLKVNDPTFYNLYMSCVKAQSVSEKFKIYSDLVKVVFNDGEYGLWNKNIINPSIKGTATEEEKDKAVEYWKSLVN